VAPDVQDRFLDGVTRLLDRDAAEPAWLALPGIPQPDGQPEISGVF
jgi:hypothetical protein